MNIKYCYTLQDLKKHILCQHTCQRQKDLEAQKDLESSIFKYCFCPKCVACLWGTPCNFTASEIHLQLIGAHHICLGYKTTQFCAKHSLTVFLPKKKSQQKTPQLQQQKCRNGKTFHLLYLLQMLVSSYFFLIRASHPIQKLTFRFVQECHKDKNSS